MRSLINVIDQMLVVIPVSESELRERLEWHKKDASWQKKVHSIFVNEPDLYESITCPTCGMVLR